MRAIKLTGREMNVVRALGFTEPMSGAEVQDSARMEDLQRVIEHLERLDRRRVRETSLPRTSADGGDVAILSNSIRLRP